MRNNLASNLAWAWTAASAGFGVGKILADRPIEGLLWCILAQLAAVMLLLARERKMRELTYSQLVEARACHEQLALFQERYGDQVSVTVEAAQEAAQLFDWDWAADMLLSLAARAAYRAAIVSAREARDSAIAPALAAYRAAQAEAFALAYISDGEGGR